MTTLWVPVTRPPLCDLVREHRVRGLQGAFLFVADVFGEVLKARVNMPGCVRARPASSLRVSGVVSCYDASGAGSGDLDAPRTRGSGGLPALPGPMPLLGSPLTQGRIRPAGIKAALRFAEVLQFAANSGLSRGPGSTGRKTNGYR